MAVNKNFVVKNGLEVDTNTLFVDSANNRVAIGTTVPTATLDVRGKILSDSQVESFVGKFVGIVTAGAVGVTTMTALDAVVTGFSTLGLANATSLNVTTGFSTVQSLTATDLTVSIGATVTKDLNVGAAATVGAALTVSGTSKLQNVQVGAGLTVIGISTFTGSSTFTDDVTIHGSAKNFRVQNSSGSTKFTVASNTGNTTIVGDVDIDGSLDVSDLFSVKDDSGNTKFAVANATGNTQILGTLGVAGDVDIADKIIHTGDTNTAIRFPAADTIQFETGGSKRVSVDSDGKLVVTPQSSLSKIVNDTSDGSDDAILTIGGGGDVFTARGAIAVLSGNEVSDGRAQLFAGKTSSSFVSLGAGPSSTEGLRVIANANVGIQSVAPAFELDVDGDINSTGTVRQNGTAITEIVSGDATALAIALG